MARITVGSVGLLLLLGCPAKPVDAILDSGAEIVAEVVDAGPPQQLPLDVRISFDLADAGLQHLPIEPGVRTVVPQVARIELETNQPIRNYRVRLFDEADKVVPSSDSADDLPERLRYVIGLETPLRTGFRYAIVFDAQTGAAMLDAEGRPISDLRYELAVAGVRQKPEPAPKKKKSAPKKRKK